MLDYRVRIDGVEAGLDGIGDPQMRETALRFARALEGQLGPATCKVHGRPASVMLNFEQGSLQGWGLGPCCKEFADLLLDRVKILELPYVQSEPVITARLVRQIGQA